MHTDVLRHVDENEVILLARKLCEFTSFSGEEKGVAEYLAGYLAAQGMDVELQEAEPDRPNVIARVPGSGGGPSLMFNGHLDIDPLPRGYTGERGTSSVDEKNVYGAGMVNMKAGVAAMVSASLAIHRSKMPLRGDVIIAGVVGELQGGIGTHHLIEQGLVPDYAIVPEPTDLNIRTIHAGVIEAVIKVSGKTSWIGYMDQVETVNAIEKMSKIVASLSDLKLTHTPDARVPGLPRHVVGGILGGVGEEYSLWRPAWIPDGCAIAVDIRLAPGMTFESVEADLRALLDGISDQDPELRYELCMPPGAYEWPFHAMKYFMPPNDLSLSDPLVRSLQSAHEQVVGALPEKVGVVVPGSYAGADSGHLAAAGTKALNYGPSWHFGRRDAVSVRKLLDGTKVMALTAVDICSRWAETA